MVHRLSFFSKQAIHIIILGVVVYLVVVSSFLVVGAGAADVVAGLAVVGFGAPVVDPPMQSSNNGFRGPPQVLQFLSCPVLRLHFFSVWLKTQYWQPRAVNWSQSSSHSLGSAIVPTGGSRSISPL